MHKTIFQGTFYELAPIFQGTFYEFAPIFQGTFHELTPIFQGTFVRKDNKIKEACIKKNYFLR